MPNFNHHIFICTNQRPAENPRGSCDETGIGSLQVSFKKELAMRGLKSDVRANKSGCLDQCEHGPVVVIYPEGVWYGGVTSEDIPEIIESHLIAGIPVERIRLAPDCINTPDCPHRGIPGDR
jgi:(2Fe-2S) ferredoxin